MKNDWKDSQEVLIELARKLPDREFTELYRELARMESERLLARTIMRMTCFR